MIFSSGSMIYGEPGRLLDRPGLRVSVKALEIDKFREDGGGVATVRHRHPNPRIFLKALRNSTSHLGSFGRPGEAAAQGGW
jgi:hypothetical protein